jgi:hypothetical protein
MVSLTTDLAIVDEKGLSATLPRNFSRGRYIYLLYRVGA